MATGGQDEAVLSSTNLPVDKFILHINSVCHLAIAENANGIDGFVLFSSFQIYVLHKLLNNFLGFWG